MKKIYWFLQQLKYLGGTETATISIANELVNDYDITFIVTDKESETIPYDIDKRIKIIYLNRPDNCKIDEKILEFCKEKSYFKAFLLTLKNINFMFFSKFKVRNKILKMTTKEDILIGSSLDNYMIIPRKRYFILHYHFNAKFYKSFNERFTSMFYRKPDKFVFLSDTILTQICGKNKRKKSISVAINNPIKTNGFLDFKYHDNSLVFIGRFADQKNPLLLIEIMNELKKINTHFHLDMYGEGKLKEEIIKSITKNNLENFITIHEPTVNVEEALKEKDLMILTSDYEGMPLVINEAASCSVPVISTNFGESTSDSITYLNGVVINTKDPKIFAEELNIILSNPKKIENLKVSSYYFSQKYNRKNIKNEWIKILK